MAFRYLDKDGALSFWTNIKNYILSKIPTKTSELTNDSGYLTSHQSLANYVTTNTDQDIEGNKNFKGLLTTIPNGTIWPATASTTDDITYLGANAIHVEQKSSGKLTDLSGGAWCVAELGVGCFFFRINNGTDIRYKHLGQNTVNRIPVVSGANRFINDVTPNENNTYSLGTSSLRWKECYSNAYYLGSTAFGDIVTHNASEFLTSHQSLSNYVTLDGTQTIAGTKTFSSTISGSISGNAGTANKVYTTIAADTTATLVQGNIASNDLFRIAAGGAANAGWAEIATGDDANEPIYVRQYKGAFTTLQRTATLLDGSGNTSFPGTVTATGFSGPVSDIPSGTTYVGAVADGGAVVNSQAVGFGAIWRAPTKNYQVAAASWPSNGDNVYICYSVANTDVTAGNNTVSKSLIWAADTGTLTTTTFSGALSGNASSATQFSANTTVALTGDATGTSAGSKKGWSVPVTLANSGVTAGTYGPSADVTGNNNATISVPEITVDAKGRVTSVTNRTLTCKNNTYNVYNKTLTIQKNGTNVATFTSNSNTDVTANITVPTKTSELTNDSGFLTSHQSLANYLTKTTNVSEMGRYIDLHYDNATSKYDYDARLYVDSQGTAAGGGSFKIAAASAYAPAPASNANDTRIATTAWVNSKGYLTSHPSITLSTNTTSTASPAHGGTFTCIDSVTQDTNGHITKVNTKTITLPADNNTDTKVTQTVTTANSNYPVLLCATANATETGTTTSRFSAGLAVNARYSSISMTNKYDTANTKGVRDSTKGYLNGDIIFKCYDDSEMGRIHCESSKNGYQQTYMQARSYIKNGAISPEGTATTCYITVRVRDNGSKTIYTDGSWENSLTPYANETYDIGTSSLRWMRCYCKNFYGSYVDIAGRYLENEYSTNARTCLYLKSNRDTDGQSGIYFSKFRQNRAQGALTGSDLVDLSLDVLENSVRTNSCISISFRYFENNVPTKIYFIPKKSMTSYMGTADNPWTNAYITNLILNGNAFDPASVSGNIGDIVFACAYYSSITGTTALELTVSGNVLYLAGFDNTTLVINSSSSSLPGTWKFLGTGKPTTTSGNADTKRVGLWKRIA